jgi:hypothetical protein
MPGRFRPSDGCGPICRTALIHFWVEVSIIILGKPPDLTAAAKLYDYLRNRYFAILSVLLFLWAARCLVLSPTPFPDHADRVKQLRCYVKPFWRPLDDSEGRTPVARPLVRGRSPGLVPVILAAPLSRRTSTLDDRNLLTTSIHCVTVKSWREIKSRP